MIDVANKLKIIRQLVQEGGESKLRYAALECRLAIEEICYERLRIAHKYISIEKIRSWQPPKLLKFLFEEVEPSLLGGSKLSISKEPVDGLKELKREDYEAMEWVEIGKQSSLDLQRISKLYYKISKHLHAKMPKSEATAVNIVGDEIGRHVQEVVAELSLSSKGRIEFFWPSKVVHFDCLCGENISRTEHSLNTAKFVSCIKSACNITYVPKLTDVGYELLRRVATIKCPHCSSKILQEFADVEKLSIGHVHATTCPQCGGGLKVSPGFKVSKHDA
jgi:DNA-directed RNA polymerase subunit RPC12/RpoP